MVEAEPAKIKIGLDIDDVLADFQSDTDRGFISFYNRTFGTYLSLPDIISFDYTQVLGISLKEVINRVMQFYGTGWFKDLIPMPDAQQIVTELSGKFSLKVITSRPESIASATITWLDKHFPMLQDVSFANGYLSSTRPTRTTKAEICYQEGISLIVEDSSVFAGQCEEMGIPVVLFDRPWNRDIPDTDLIIRARNWHEVPNVISHFLDST